MQICSSCYQECSCQFLLHVCLILLGVFCLFFFPRWPHVVLFIICCLFIRPVNIGVVFACASSANNLIIHFVLLQSSHRQFHGNNCIVLKKYMVMKFGSYVGTRHLIKVKCLFIYFKWWFSPWNVFSKMLPKMSYVVIIIIIIITIVIIIKFKYFKFKEILYIKCKKVPFNQIKTLSCK